MAIDMALSADEPRTGSGAITVLTVLTAGWTWRTDPDDELLPARDDARAVDPELVRAFAWAGVVIG